MIAWAKELKESTQLRWNNVHKFQPKINMAINFGSYTLKTADTTEELIASFRLRHEVFFQEFQGVKKSGLDVDQFDWHFDHLIIVHRETKKVIGTYRLCSSHFTYSSYTALEFNLTEILSLEGPFLELGRACIHQQHRRGAVISLLWRGIAEYMNLSTANVLFGCSSLKINNTRQAALVYKLLLDQGAVLLNSASSPTKNFKMNDFQRHFDQLPKVLSLQQVEEAESLLPSLLKSYLKLGAKIASEPAFDKDFDCIDMLTVLKRSDLANSLARRFQVVR